MAESETTTRVIVESMLADDWTVREIAERLGLSTQAVYYHRDQIAAQTARSDTQQGQSA